MRKAALITMFGISTFLIVRAWYQRGNSGIPTPSVLSRPAYAFGLLLLLSDFVGNVAVVIGAMSTVVLAWQLPGVDKTGAKGPKIKVRNTPKGTQVQPPKKPGVNP